MSELVTYSTEDGIATLAMDDGKANALSVDMSTALSSGLDRAEKEAQVVVITGRPGVLCGGFDLKVIRGDDDGAKKRMREAGYDLLRRLYLYPLPLIIACPGHAVAAGGLLLLTADVRIGVSGDFRIGLNEVAIGLALPVVGLELAKDRLSPNAITAAVLGAQLFDPLKAAEAGYLDDVAMPETFDQKIRETVQGYLALDGAAFAMTKKRLRSATVARMKD